IVMRTISANNNGGEIFQSEQISFVLGSNFILSFQESDEPIFEPVLKRLETTGTRLRRLAVDYLAYALLDNVVDHYFSALDQIGESIESIEELNITDPKP